ncbi:hypothetical protein, partial [Helicobacter cinaedi]|uniref:hypothetical protein n=2 Tax=Helicobacter cinaedi TaxID=213 RepID=UPI001A9CC545
ISSAIAKLAKLSIRLNATNAFETFIFSPYVVFYERFKYGVFFDKLKLQPFSLKELKRIFHILDSFGVG